MSVKVLTTEIVAKEELRPAVVSITDEQDGISDMRVLVHTIMRGEHGGVIVEHEDGLLEEVFPCSRFCSLRFIDSPHSEYAWEEADEE